MNRDRIDALWQQATHIAIAEGAQLARYHFAALVAAAEREACARTAENWDSDIADPRDIADAIRARGTP